MALQTCLLSTGLAAVSMMSADAQMVRSSVSVQALLKLYKKEQSADSILLM
jgi:hypothetical protein